MKMYFLQRVHNPPTFTLYNGDAADYEGRRYDWIVDSGLERF